MKLQVLSGLLGFLMLTTVFAQENYETVVEGSAFNSSSKIILNEEAIRKSKSPDITTLLSTQANITISNSSIQPSSIFIRGGDSSHVLILVDGLPFYDPSTLQKTINLNDLDIRSVRRIEVIKGSQSVLYGGQALTGVIKIETFPKEIEPKAKASLEGGQRDYRKISLEGHQPLRENQEVLARAFYSEKNNRSPVMGSSVDYPHHLLGGDLGYLYMDEYDFFFKASRFEDESKLPSLDASSRALDAVDFTAETTVTSFLTGLRGKNWKMKPQLWAGYQYGHRRYDQPSSAADDKYDSELLSLRFESLPVDLENFQLLAGASFTRETLLEKNIIDSVQADAANEMTGVFTKFSWLPVEVIEIEAGVRGDYILASRDRVVTHQMGLILFKDLKLEYATGFKTPSLSQLYSYAPNPDLKPESSKTYTLSYTRQLSQGQAASLTLFESSFENLITTMGAPPAVQNVNLAKGVSRGVEAQYSARFQSQTRFDFNYGYQEPWDVENARRLLRRPLHTGSVRLSQDFEKSDISFESVWTGERVDRFSFSPPSYGSLPAYIISNLAYTHELSENASAYLRGNNIFNDRYEESRGYHNEGAFWLVGVELRD